MKHSPWKRGESWKFPGVATGVFQLKNHIETIKLSEYVIKSQKKTWKKTPNFSFKIKKKIFSKYFKTFSGESPSISA